MRFAQTLPVFFAMMLASEARAEQVTVFAAASLTNALAEIEVGFEAETGHAVALSFAGSSVLARQIELGAPADIFFPANADWMDWVDAQGLIAPGTRVNLVRNRLVLIAVDPEAEPVDFGERLDLATRLGEERLAMALVDAVPAGIYGKAALQHLGLWEEVAPRVVQADNVRAALAFVTLGETPYGIVYATDAVAADEVQGAVRVVGTFPEESHPPILYPVAGVAGRVGPAQEAFLAYLQSAPARAAFERQGFVPLAE